MCFDGPSTSCDLMDPSGPSKHMSAKKSTLLGPAVRRLQKELQRLVTSPADGIKVSDETCNASDLASWKIDLSGPKETLFEGENFQLSFQFDEKYPFDSPIVTFTGDNIPKHPHVYSNGHICLSILTTDWSPALTVQSVFLSMLASATEKARPLDNFLYVKTCSKNPKKSSWRYDDDKV